MFTVTSASEDLSPSRGNWLVSSSLRTFSQRLSTSTILFHIRASSPYITWLANTTGWGASETRWTAAVFSKVFTNSSLKSSLAFWVGAPTNFSWRALALSARTQNSNPCSSSVWITKYYHSLTFLKRRTWSLCRRNCRKRSNQGPSSSRSSSRHARSLGGLEPPWKEETLNIIIHTKFEFTTLLLLLFEEHILPMVTSCFIPQSPASSKVVNIIAADL